jgi:sporulation protein YlmC with PRC-barrel domain
VSQDIRLEELLGKVVRNDFGRAVARIEDLWVEPEGEDYVVTHYLLGPLEPWPRLVAFAGQLPTFRALGLGRKSQLRPIPWHWLDLSDPERPRLSGRATE